MTLNTFFHEFFFTPNAMLPHGHWWIELIRAVLRALIALFAVLLIVPPLVWFERRLLGFMQQRQGPNRVGPFGLLQTIADGLKLLLKEDIIPNNVDRSLYVMAPILMLIPAMVTGGVIPWSPSLTWGAVAPNVGIGILYTLAFSSLAVYGIVLAGWSSNNKYALLGGLRSSAQIISYELGMGLAVVTVVLISGSLGTHDIVYHQGGDFTKPAEGFWGYTVLIGGLWHLDVGFPKWHIFQLFPMGFTAGIIYIISMIAETNRAPFDLPEAETELVAGYHTEYTSMKFAMFFLGEYANMVVVSAIAVTLFFGGYSAPLPWLNQLPPFMVSLYAHDPATGGASLAHWGVPWLTMIVNSILPAVWFTIKVILFLYTFIWIRATLPRLRYDMLMDFGWKGILPISLFNILCVAIAQTYGYFVGVIAWVIIAAISIVVVASTAASKRFTDKTRRARTLQMHSQSVPFLGSTGVTGRGGQTFPPQALKERASAAYPTGDSELPTQQKEAAIK